MDTTTGEYKHLMSAPNAARSVASSLINLVPLDILLPLVIQAGIKIATTGTGARSKQIKKVLVLEAKAVEAEFPGEVCGG